MYDEFGTDKRVVGSKVGSPSAGENAAGQRVLFVGADAAYTYAFRRNLMQALQAQGHEVSVAASPLGDFDPALFQDMGVAFLPWNVAKAGLNPLADLGALAKLRAIIAKLRPNILFVHTIKPVIYGAVVGWLTGVDRRVAMIPGLGHTFMPPKSLPHRVARFVARQGYRFALARAHTVIFHNDDDIAEMRALGVLRGRADARRVYGSGVDMDHFAAAPPPEGPAHFLMVARLLQEKGVREFVDAARRVRAVLPEVRFSLVGAPDANPSAVTAEELAAWGAEGVVELVGRVGDPRPYFAACSVFVLPSWREGTPRTNLEAMACGRAIITTDAPGCRETVRPGVNGLLVPVRDPGALAKAMLMLAKDPDRVRAMGHAGRAFCAEHFELGKVTRETVAMILG